MTINHIVSIDKRQAAGVRKQRAYPTAQAKLSLSKELTELQQQPGVSKHKARQVIAEKYGLSMTAVRNLEKTDTVAQLKQYVEQKKEAMGSSVDTSPVMEGAAALPLPVPTGEVTQMLEGVPGETPVSHASGPALEAVEPAKKEEELPQGSKSPMSPGEKEKESGDETEPAPKKARVEEEYEGQVADAFAAQKAAPLNLPQMTPGRFQESLLLLQGQVADAFAAQKAAPLNLPQMTPSTPGPAEGLLPGYGSMTASAAAPAMMTGSMAGANIQQHGAPPAPSKDDGRSSAASPHSPEFENDRRYYTIPYGKPDAAL
eukprot:s1293_g5.t1